MPLCKGGTNELGNLVAACIDCNQGKAGKPLKDPSIVGAA